MMQNNVDKSIEFAAVFWSAPYSSARLRFIDAQGMPESNTSAARNVGAMSNGISTRYTASGKTTILTAVEM